jgi:hypothetical protein
MEEAIMEEAEAGMNQSLKQSLNLIFVGEPIDPCEENPEAEGCPPEPPIEGCPTAEGCESEPPICK